MGKAESATALLMHQVLIHPASYDDCAAAVAEAFARFAPEMTGRRVLVKPNLLRASAAEDGIVTNPAVLAAVIQEIEARGPAEIVVGDNPGLYSYGANEAAFAQTGLGAAAGAYYRNIGTEGVTLPLKTSGFDGTVSVSRAVMAADVVISLPKFKTHGLTVITGAIKNSYGILPGAQKARLHLLAGGPAPFNDTIVDVFNMRWSWPERLFKTNGAWMPPGMEPCLPPRGRQAPRCQTGGD